MQAAKQVAGNNTALGTDAPAILKVEGKTLKRVQWGGGTPSDARTCIM